MQRQQFQLLSRFLLMPAIWLAGACAAADVPTPTPSAPSAAAFDALFKRLDVGDLIVLDTQQQIGVINQLKTLLPPGDAHRQRLLDTQRCFIEFSNSLKEGFAFAETGLAEAIRANDTEATARYYYCRGGYQKSVGTPTKAIDDFEKGIELSRKSEDNVLLAQGLASRGDKFSVLGLHGKALADLLQAQRIYQQNQLQEAASQIFQSIGIAYRRLGYLDKAREYLVQSMEQEQRAGDRESLYGSTLQLGFTEEESGNFGKALALDQQALEIAIKTGDKTSIGSAQIAIAGAQSDLQHYPDALAALDNADANFAAAGDAGFTGMVAFERGRALAGLGQLVQANDMFERAEKAPDFNENQRYLELLFGAKAKNLEAAGRAPAALREYKRYLAAHEEVVNQRQNQQAQMLREQFDTDRSQLENARLKAEQARLTAEQELKDRQVETLKRVRGWQEVALGLLIALLGLLGFATIRQLARSRIWKRMASIDPLTGAANRRGVDHFGVSAVRNARTQHEPLSLLAVDLDLFKRVNDRFGHAAGDRALQQIASACQHALREHDLFGRIGGEEFLAVLPGTTLAHAAEVAERLRSRVETLVFEDLPSDLHATISVGVVELNADDGSFADLEKRADSTLYRAKSGGRNRVVIAGDSSFEAAVPEASTTEPRGAAQATS